MLSPTLILDVADWAVYRARIAAQTDGNVGDVDPARFPVLVFTAVSYHGSVTAGPEDYSVLHGFVYGDDAERLVAATRSRPSDPAPAAMADIAAAG